MEATPSNCNFAYSSHSLKDIDLCSSLSNTMYQFVPSEMWSHFLVLAASNGNFYLVNKEVNNFIAEGYSVSQMLNQLIDIIVDKDDISDDQKARICKKLGEVDKRLVDGADEYLQLLDVASNTMQAFGNKLEGFAYEG